MITIRKMEKKLVVINLFNINTTLLLYLIFKNEEVDQTRTCICYDGVPWKRQVLAKRIFQTLFKFKCSSSKKVIQRGVRNLEETGNIQKKLVNIRLLRDM